MPNTKTCARCGVVQTPENSHMRAGGKYFYAYCRPCRNIVTKEYAANNKEAHAAKQKRATIKWRYGLDSAAYEALLLAGCAVCGSTEGLCVDHDHSCCPGRRSCGKCVRGALCNRHNVALGMVNESTEELQILIEYVLQSNARRAIIESNG